MSMISINQFELFIFYFIVFVNSIYICILLNEFEVSTVVIVGKPNYMFVGAIRQMKTGSSNLVFK